jgi:hypothetical protein
VDGGEPEEQQPMYHRLTGVLCVLALALFLTGPAGAIPLSDLIGAPPQTMGDLVFSDFSVSVTGDLLSNLCFYEVELGIDGLVLNGPFSAADGEVGAMSLSFVVAPVDPADAIASAYLFANNEASGAGAQASVDEVLRDLNGNIIGALSTFDTGAVPGDAIFEDTIDFGAAAAGLVVTKDILLDSAIIGGGFGGSARIGLIEQRFRVVMPEPDGLALMALGMAGLIAMGSRPASGANAASHRRA